MWWDLPTVVDVVRDFGDNDVLMAFGFCCFGFDSLASCTREPTQLIIATFVANARDAIGPGYGVFLNL